MNWIQQSNLIEGVNDPKEDARSKKAWNWLLKQDLNRDSILELHRRIMLKKLPITALGKLRICNVTVGGRYCPHYQQLPGLFRGWIQKWTGEHAFIRHSTDKLDDLIKEAHIEFERIHPFVDGNGRTGRMIMNYQRTKAGLKPLCIEYLKRWEYYAWFR